MVNDMARIADLLKTMMCGVGLVLNAVAPDPSSAATTAEVTTASGLKYQDVKEGTGDVATAGKTVAVHYTGWLTNGTKFDSSKDRGQAIEKGYRVVGSARHGVPDDLKKAGVQGITALADFRASLSRPRAVFLYVPAGPPVDSVLDELLPHLDSGDIVVEGGNSYWGDSILSFERLRKR